MSCIYRLWLLTERWGPRCSHAEENRFSGLNFAPAESREYPTDQGDFLVHSEKTNMDPENPCLVEEHNFQGAIVRSMLVFGSVDSLR